MRKVVFLFVVILGISCTEKTTVHNEQIKSYYEGFKKSDYDEIKETLSDSLVTTEGDYIMAFSREGYYEKFKWDSVFKPIYKLVYIENEGEQALATVSISSLKHKFLKNSPMTCSYRFHFESDKIAKIENLGCPDANWEVWGKERDALVKWTKENHQELDGFIHDLTMKGAQDYITAIALYTNRKDAD
ncbi:MAG: hypothetical protein WBB27_13515 [Maribacter sp.]